MNKQQKYDKLYLDIAKRVSEMSYANRKKVGAVIVKDGNIISFGWNGSPSGFDNECEDEDGITLPYVVHAEQNALYKLARSGESAVGSTLYLTLSPCITCALGIIQSGISRVVYLEEYSDTSSLDFLEASNIEVVMVGENELTPDEKDIQHYLTSLEYGRELYKDNIPTWIFDQLGYYGTEEDLAGFSYGEVKVILRQRELMKEVMIRAFGEVIGMQHYNDWVEHRHDT